MQMIVLYLSLVLMALIVIAFLRAARAASASAVPAPAADYAAVERHRRNLILGLLVLGIVVSLASLWRWPYAVNPASAAVNISGGQWYWEIDRTEVPLGQPIAFNIHTTDVNHGAGIMDSSGRILGQAQAMPGYVNRFELTFDTPGTYSVVCLEYCGVAHHDMINEFTVVAQGEN